MREFLIITKALSDEARVRALLSLRDGELCLCQLVEFLSLAPSTVSKHMTLLAQAGLVRRRKLGRWHYYRLAGREAEPAAGRALKFLFASLAPTDASPSTIADAKALRRIRSCDPAELTGCYSTPRTPGRERREAVARR